MAKLTINGSVPTTRSQLGDDQALRTFALQAFREYFDTLNGHAPVELYDLVLKEIELPLFQAVMNYTRGNQSRAAEILGINRGTLRKKLRIHGLIH